MIYTNHYESPLGNFLQLIVYELIIWEVHIRELIIWEVHNTDSEVG